MDLEELVLRIRVWAQDVQGGIDEVKAALGDVDSANEKSAASAKKASIEAAMAYQQQAESADKMGTSAAAATAAVAMAAEHEVSVVKASTAEIVAAREARIQAAYQESEKVIAAAAESYEKEMELAEQKKAQALNNNTVRYQLNGYEEITAAAQAAYDKQIATAQAAFDKIAAAAEAGAQKEVAAAEKAADQATKAAERATAKQEAVVKKSAAAQVGAYAMIAAAAVKAYATIRNEIADSITSLNQYTIAMQGLESAANRQGMTASKTVKTLASVTDEIVGATEAGTALRHLLDSGLGADKAANLLNRFKDAAALSRSENVSLTQAVVAAAEAVETRNTRGLKAIGIVKTETEMWQDYAKSVGLVVGDLTEAMKTEAIYQGIMGETAGKVGDYATYQTTLAGAQERTAQSGQALALTFGDSISPAVQLANDILAELYGTLGAITGACPPLTAGITVAVTAALGFVALKKSVDTVKALTAGINGLTGALGVSSGALGAMTLVIGLATAGYTAYRNAQQAAAEAEAEAAQKREENIKQLKSSSDWLQSAAKRYEELSSKQRLTWKESQELKSIESDLAKQHGLTAEKVRELTAEYGNLGAAMSGLATQDLKGLLNAQTNDLEAVAKSYESAVAGAANPRSREGNIVFPPKMEEYIAKAKTEFADLYAKVFDLGDTKAKLAGVGSTISDMISGMLRDAFDISSFSDEDIWTGAAYDAIKVIPDLFERIATATASTPGFDQAQKVVAEMREKIIQGLEITSDDEARLQSAIYTIGDFGAKLTKALYDSNLSDADAEKLGGYIYDQLLGVFNTQSNDEVSQAIKAFNEQIKQDFWDAFNAMSLEDKTAAFDGVSKSVSDLTNSFKDLATELSNMQAAQGALDGLSENGLQADGAKEMIALIEQYTGLTVKSNDDISQAYRYTGAEIDRLTQRHEDLNLRSDELIGTYERMADKLDTDATPALERLMNASARADDALQAVTDQELDDLKTDFVGLGATIESLSARLQTTTKRAENLKEIKKVMAMNAEGTAEWGRAMALLGISTTATADEAKQAVSDMESSLKAESTSIQDALNAAYNDLLAFVEAASAHPELNIDTAPALAAIQALFSPLNNLLGLMGLAKVKPAGGGGGGNKDSWYQQQIKDMEHLQKLGQLTYEQELAYLERIAASRGRLKKDEQKDLDERLYQAREDVRQKRIDDDYADLDHRKALNQISLADELSALEAIKASHQMNAEELREIEEKLYDAREALRAKALADDYAAVDHRKAMGELTLAQELETLQAIKAAREMNAEEELQWQERVYALNQEIRRKAIEDDYADLAHEKTMGRLGYQAEVEWLERIRDKHQMTAEEQRQIEEELYQAREQYRQSLLRGDYAALEHRKRMGELTLEQELETLQAIKAAREMNADELLEIAEKLYAQEQAIRSRDANSITKLMNSLTKALSERYKAMRDEEVDLLNASKDAWGDWADENVKAIQAQIDALDALLKKEDSEAQDAKELKQIASLQEQIMFERDEYNRRQLQAQLDKAIADREARLRRESIEAQKEALKEQQDAIKEQAKNEQEVIDGQIDEIKKNYEERLKAAAIQAEAERLLMQGNQEAILDLLREYEVDYNATGQTLGEALLDGFTSVVGGVLEWFDDFNAQVLATQEMVKRLALEASDNFDRAQKQKEARQVEALAKATATQTITIYQNQTFQQPIESPYDVARKVRQMNEDLARTINL